MTLMSKVVKAAAARAAERVASTRLMATKRIAIILVLTQLSWRLLIVRRKRRRERKKMLVKQVMLQLLHLKQVWLLVSLPLLEQE